ncbi:MULTISPECIES: LysR family transcriptional regulator [Pseudomonas]|uniref:LysR family transcriptional regulator n=1 Tax=Pseudomonas auratipiscis TaxID=3115853 RepID=A0AB35WVH1_9PSED|nr:MULTISPECIES: LysR family transcriptional regulator [unclassified Pseudomonas]MEE1867918.1 LysR family transcriptional regulator [Pseudomonas sp. 120P]MEE1959498.1 LysR family transcriptional regulator [Pseudomonas sp. 119P]
MLFENLALFLLIVEKGGLSAAGREAGLSPTSVSERLGALERYYGATLLVRTTRSISLTDEGRVLVERVRPLLAEAEDIASTIKLGTEQVSGVVRLSAPVDLGRNRIVPILDEFLEHHPDISVDLNLTDGFVDLAGQGLDFAIRYGALSDSTLRVKKLSEGRRVVCAAPAYLSKHGTPQHPRELIAHQCLLMRFGNNIHREWQFWVDGGAFKVSLSGRRVANDGEQVRRWCLAGLGICIKSQLDVREDLDEGRLIELLPDYALQGVDLQIVYPSSHAVPRRVQRLMDMIALRLAA